MGYDNSMKPQDFSRRSPCPISLWLDLLGDKWTLLIIRDLIFHQKSTYGEFLASHEKISTNILADRLKKLEAGGFICKTVDPDNRSRFIYRVTQKAIDLLPMLLEMIAWTTRYVDDVGTPDDFIRQLQDDRAGLIRTLTESLKTCQEINP